MLPVLGIILAAAGQSITAAEAAIIGASVGAAAAISANAVTKKPKNEKQAKEEVAEDDG